MIKNTEPISMSESLEYTTSDTENNKKIKIFIKKFSKIDSEDSKKLRKKIESLEIIKINSESIAKVIDFLPEDSEDINKIFNDMSLDEKETEKILDLVKEFK